MSSVKPAPLSSPSNVPVTHSSRYIWLLGLLIVTSLGLPFLVSVLFLKGASDSLGSYPFLAPMLMYYAVILMKLWRGNLNQLKIVQGPWYWVGIIGFPAIPAALLYALFYASAMLASVADKTEGLLIANVVTLCFYLYWVIFGGVVKLSAGKPVPATSPSSLGARQQ
jgi:hypothetical protein